MAEQQMRERLAFVKLEDLDELMSVLTVEFDFDGGTFAYWGEAAKRRTLEPMRPGLARTIGSGLGDGLTARDADRDGVDVLLSTETHHAGVIFWCAGDLVKQV